MKKVLLTAVFLLLCIWLHAQNILGEVYREGTDSVIAGATVYYGGSMAGTTTNGSGKFKLLAKQEQVPVVISCIGYYTKTVTYKPGELLIVYLKPKQEQLKTVVIRADGMNRDEEIRIFKREFLGTSEYALSCTIVNIDDIDFFYDRHTETLTANCDKPIMIENKKLGYTITYFLDSFERKPKVVYFTGNYIFKEQAIPDGAAMTKIKRNREYVYENSRMQLIRAIWAHTIKKTGFRLYTPYFDALTEDSIVVRDSMQREYLMLRSRIVISHSSNTRYTTVLTPLQKFAFIDKDGYYAAGALQWAGRLTTQRIGDLLPFEFQSEKETKGQVLPDSAAIATVSNNTAPGNQGTISDNKDWKQFVSVALMPNNGLDPGKVARKWEQPVRYKIYGSYGNSDFDKSITDNIHQTFKKLEPLTGLSITNTQTDSIANLFIIIGDAREYMNILPPEAIQYFNKSADNNCYYTASEKGFTRMVICIKPVNDSEKHIGPDSRKLQDKWCEARLILMKGLGFSGISDDPSSLFSNYFSQWLPINDIKPSDASIIKALYSPNLKSGMNEQEAYNAVKNLFPGVIIKRDKAAERELQYFKSIVLVNDNPIVNQPVVRKWARPINYKIYGSCGNPKLDQSLAKDVRSLFNFFSKNSGVQVNQASADSAVNFFIMLSGNPESYARVLPPDATAYFNNHTGSAGYYSYSDTSFTTMTKFLHLDKMDDPNIMLPAMASALRQHIFNGLGFFNYSPIDKGSIFNTDVDLDTLSPQVRNADINVIRTLYQPAVESGMTEKELDTVLNRMAIN